MCLNVTQAVGKARGFLVALSALNLYWFYKIVLMAKRVRTLIMEYTFVHGERVLFIFLLVLVVFAGGRKVGVSRRF